jgi:hypothetical protein
MYYFLLKTLNSGILFDVALGVVLFKKAGREGVVEENQEDWSVIVKATIRKRELV